MNDSTVVRADDGSVVCIGDGTDIRPRRDNFTVVRTNDGTRPPITNDGAAVPGIHTVTRKLQGYQYISQPDPSQVPLNVSEQQSKLQQTSFTLGPLDLDRFLAKELPRKKKNDSAALRGAARRACGARSGLAAAVGGAPPLQTTPPSSEKHFNN